jgi:hypothetical protein
LFGCNALNTSYEPDAYKILLGVGNAFTRVKNPDGTITDTLTGDRRNALTVWIDGHITAGRETLIDDKSETLTTKGFVENEINEAYVKLDKSITAVNNKITNLKLP